jgi:hypothetical protein
MLKSNYTSYSKLKPGATITRNFKKTSVSHLYYSQWRSGSICSRIKPLCVTAYKLDIAGWILALDDHVFFLSITFKLHL